MKLVISDLSNIEGRILAYLAGEEWKLDAFRAYDAGTGPDLYNITATGIIGGDPYTVTKKNRNIFGKVPDLALGYEGGAGALQTFAKGYGVKMEEQWPTIQENIAPEHVVKARENLASWGQAKQLEMGISELEWIASETVKLAWRARHPATRSLWYAVKDAAVWAIKSPGAPFQAGQHLTFQTVQHASGNWLVCLLPSGKFLTYYDPQLTADGGISYMGMGTELGGSTSRAWVALYTYGGKLVENATQAVAGDVLKATMPTIEAAGYEIVLTVHDEDVTQTPDDPRFNADELSRLLATPPTWAPTLPLAAAGFEAYRYKKED